MASLIKCLSDEDLEVVRHMIRRDAHTDEQIWAEVVSRLPADVKADGERLSKDAGSQAVRRYKASDHYGHWLDRVENSNARMQEALAKQAARFSFIAETCQTAGEDGFERASKHILARGLTLAAELDDEEFMQAMSAKGFAKSVAEIAAGLAKDQYRRKFEELRKQMEAKATEIMSDGGLSPEERAKRVREIFSVEVPA